jgi:hypothetical protein
MLVTSGSIGEQSDFAVRLKWHPFLPSIRQRRVTRKPPRMSRQQVVLTCLQKLYNIYYRKLISNKGMPLF